MRRRHSLRCKLCIFVSRSGGGGGQNLYPLPVLPALNLTSMLLHVLAVVLIVVPLVCGQRGTAQTFFPASIPLAVRTPYLSTWQNATDGQPPLSSSWPVFWTQNVRRAMFFFHWNSGAEMFLGGHGMDWEH